MGRVLGQSLVLAVLALAALAPGALAAPVASSISPTALGQGGTHSFAVNGSGFVSGAVVSTSAPGVTASSTSS